MPAPGSFGRPVARVAPATFDPLFPVDGRATALLIAEFARRHVAREATWDRSATFTSGERVPGRGLVRRAKAALENLTMSAACGLAPYGVTANVVYPPPTDTGWVTDAVRAEVEPSSPTGRVATPDEVTGMVVFLTSRPADRFTGEVLCMS